MLQHLAAAVAMDGLDIQGIVAAVIAPAVMGEHYVRALAGVHAPAHTPPCPSQVIDVADGKVGRLNWLGYLCAPRKQVKYATRQWSMVEQTGPPSQASFSFSDLLFTNVPGTRPQPRYRLFAFLTGQHSKIGVQEALCSAPNSSRLPAPLPTAQHVRRCLCCGRRQGANCTPMQVILTLIPAYMCPVFYHSPGCRCSLCFEFVSIAITDIAMWTWLFDQLGFAGDLAQYRHDQSFVILHPYHSH